MKEDTKDRIQNFKRELSSMKEKYNQYKGVRDNQLKTLKEKFGLSTIEEANKREGKLKKELFDLKTELDTKVDQFERKYKI